MPTLICPNCQSTNLRRSHTHGFREKLLKLFYRVPYRCRDCGWRGIVFSVSNSDSKVSKRRSYAFAVFFMAIIILLLIVFNTRPEVVEHLVKNLFGRSK